MAHDGGGEGRVLVAQDVLAGVVEGDLVQEGVARQPVPTCVPELGHPGHDVGDHGEHCSQAEREPEAHLLGRLGTTTGVQAPGLGRRRETDHQDVQDQEVVVVEEVAPAIAVAEHGQQGQREDRTRPAVPPARGVGPTGDDGEEEDGGDQARRRRRGDGAQHPGRVPAAPVEVGEVEEVGEAQDQVGHREAPSEDPESGEAAGGGDLVHVASHRWCTVTSTGGAPSCSRATAS